MAHIMSLISSFIFIGHIPSLKHSMGLSATLIKAEICLIKYPDESLEGSLLLKVFCCNDIYLNQIWLTHLSLIEFCKEKQILTNLEVI